jgi:hypothetical protein
MGRTRAHNVACPDPAHIGGRVHRHGTFETATTGPLWRFRCFPPPGLGDPHCFSVVAPGGKRQTRQRGAPDCSDHPGAVVRRFGTHGKGKNRRQRYRCDHECNATCLTRRRTRNAVCPGFHTFSHELPREHVEGGKKCQHCLELRGIHRGERLAARRQRLNSRQVARLLLELASGVSYTKVGLAALKAAGIAVVSTTLRRRPSGARGWERVPDEELDALDPDAARIADEAFADAAPLAEEPEFPVPIGDDGTEGTVVALPGDPRPKRRRRRSASTRLRTRVWHVGADLVEAFAPVVWEAQEATFRDWEQKVAAAGHPRVWLLDDRPYYTDVLGAKKQAGGYSVLALAELDPLDAALPWRARLRLARAFPRANAVAYRMLFDEIGYAPDLVISDNSSAIKNALEAHFGGALHRVPSLWHMVDALRTGILAKALERPESAGLREHLDHLGRRSHYLRSAEGWADWWDGLLELGQANGVALGKLTAARGDYEGRMAGALPLLLGNEQFPMSNSPIEALIRDILNPIFTRSRQFSFANVERTNALLDLVVAKANGAFDDLNDVAALIEKDALEFGGHTVPLRAVADPRLADGTPSRSLRDENLLLDVAAARGIR